MFVILRLILVSLLVCATSFAQLARPKLNSLEQQKGREILAAQQSAEAELAAARKGFETEGKWKPPVPAASTKDKSEPQRLKAEKARIEKETADHERRLASMREAIIRSDQRINDLARQLRYWEADTLESHKGSPDKHVVDWQAGQIKER